MREFMVLKEKGLCEIENESGYGWEKTAFVCVFWL